MLENVGEKLKAEVSRWILDAVEKLPRFQGGRLSRMQSIREHERKLAAKQYEMAKNPDGASIALKSVTIVLCYEFEKFNVVHESLRKAFPGNRRLIDQINKIRKVEDKLDGAGWSNLFTIVGPNKKYLIPEAVKCSDLPVDIERIHVSHHRLLPSMACLELTIVVSGDFSQDLRSCAESFYLPETISASLWPSRLFNGYSMSGRHKAAHAVSEKINRYSVNSSEWTLKKLRISRDHIHAFAACPLYQVSNQSTEPLASYARSHEAWLLKYGYSSSPYRAYHSDNAVLCLDDEHDGRLPRIDSLFISESSDEYFGMLVDEILRGLVSASALITQLSVYKQSVQSLRAKGFIDLSHKWKVIRKSGETVYDLKHIILRIKRALAEYENAKDWAFHSLGEVGDMKMEHGKVSATFSSNILGYFESELKSVVASASILDEAISDRLATENIYVMYTLQRRVFWLTVVVVLVAAVSLASSWDKIKPVLSELVTAAYNHSLQARQP